MKIIPAIDVRCGEFVVFIPNEDIKEKFQYHSPSEIAEYWKAKGADTIYVTDYDGLFKGVPQNLEVVEEITRATGASVIYSGGICTAYDLEKAVRAGAEEIVINISNIRSKLVSDDLFVKYRDRIIVGIDIKDSELAVEGFNNPIHLDLEGKLQELYSLGLRKVIVTDISKKEPRDRTYYKSVIKMSDRIGYRVIVAGGITSVLDIEYLRAASEKEFEAVVLGRALYMGKIKYQKEVDFNLLSQQNFIQKE